MIRIRTFVAVALLFSLLACTVGPNYKRPPVTVPGNYRGTAPEASTQPDKQSFGEMKWFTVFEDQTLESLIREALTNNYDLRIAAARVAQARAIVGIHRADQLPAVSGSGSISNHPVSITCCRCSRGLFAFDTAPDPAQA